MNFGSYGRALGEKTVMLAQVESLLRRFVNWPRQWLRKVRSPNGNADRRQWPRYPSNAETTIQPAVPAGVSRLPAKVRNVSCGGINLLAGHGFATGTLLHLDLPATTRHPAHALLTCVINVSTPMNSTWALGCSFIRELSEPELRALL